MPRAKDLGIADHSERAGREQAAQIAIALLADTASFSLPPLAGHSAGREHWLSQGSLKSRPHPWHSRARSSTAD